MKINVFQIVKKDFMKHMIHIYFVNKLQILKDVPANHVMKLAQHVLDQKKINALHVKKNIT